MATTNITLIRRPKKQAGGTVHYWTLKWADSTGKTRYKSLGRDGVMSKTEAKKLLRARISDMGAGTVSRDKAAKLTVSRFLEMDRESMAATLKPSTLRTMEQAADHLAAAIGGDTMLAAVDWMHDGKLRKWLANPHVLNGQNLKGCSKATIRKTVATLRAIWSRGVKRRLVITNPFKDEKLPRTQARAKRIFATAEATAMVAAAPTLWWATFIRLAFTTGLRVGELLNLQWSDIHDDHVVVSAKRAGHFKIEGITYPVLPWSCKSYSERTVPLHPAVALMLDELHLHSSGPYVFLSLARLLALRASRDVTQELESKVLINNMRRDYLLIQAAAGLIMGDDYEWPMGTFHDLRKSYGTIMARVVPMHELQRLMGHESITTTARYYTEATGDVVEAHRLAFAV